MVESFPAGREPILLKESLAQREIEVLKRIAGGKRAKEVAAELGLSVATIQTYLRRVYEKLQVCSPAEAVARFMR